MTRSARQLTIRLDDELARAIEHEARASHTSLNRAAASLLRKGAGLHARSEGGMGAEALERLLGHRWTAEEAAELDAAIAPLGEIDWELWGGKPKRARGRAKKR
jgi:predicted transcriptional regulator